MKQRLDELTQAIAGPRKKEWKEAMKRWRESRETWFLESSPKGDTLIIYFEAKDIPRMMQEFGASKHPFDAWLKGELAAITGADMSSSQAGPSPKQILRAGY